MSTYEMTDADLDAVARIMFAIHERRAARDAEQAAPDSKANREQGTNDQQAAKAS
jgi:hypothetical protein